MKKRIISILTSMALLLSLAACGNQDPVESTAVQPNSAYTGTVSGLSTSSITVSTADGDITFELTEDTVISGELGMGIQEPDSMGEMPDHMGQMGGETPAEKPDGEAADADNQEGTPPELPEGEAANGNDQAGTPPELPESEAANGNDQAGTPPEMPQGEMSGINSNEIQIMGGQTQSLTIADISIGDTVTVETDDEGKAASVTVSGGKMNMQMSDGNMDMPGGVTSGVDSYDAANEFTADASESGTDYASTAKDENTIHVFNGAAVDLENSTITRESADSTGGDTSSFYGVGAAALVTDGTMTIANSMISSDAAGGAGVFAYGGGVAYVMDTVIDTARDTSGGIHVAGGGTLYAWDLTVETDGESSAAIRSDRGSGTMVVDGGTYVSNGVGSPVIYSAADITVNNASLTSTGSEAICIEGLNSIRLFDCDLSGDMEDLSQNDCTWNVILYQSMSGDSQIGNSTFEMVGGSLTAGNGGMFYTTNTESTFILSGVDITYAEDSEFFLKCTGNANQRGWGTTGNNGADCTFTAVAQAMQGNVIWDSISQLDLYILENSTLIGAVVNDETNAGNGGTGYAALHIDESSTWIVTENSTLTSLHCAGTIADAAGNTVTITGTDGTIYVQGASEFTVTVDSYNNTTDISAASTVDSWSDFAVSKP